MLGCILLRGLRERILSPWSDYLQLVVCMHSTAFLNQCIDFTIFIVLAPHVQTIQIGLLVLKRYLYIYQNPKFYRHMARASIRRATPFFRCHRTQQQITKAAESNLVTINRVLMCF